MIHPLQQWAIDRGYSVAWGAMKVVLQVREEIRARRDSGELDVEFFRSELQSVVEDDGVPDEGTIVVVAKPRPAHRVLFDLGDQVLETLVPPTYVRYRPTFEDVRQDIARNALPGATVEHLLAPLKSLAARLGLVRYGRNNIAYAPGTGSYLQLCSFVTDAQLPALETTKADRPQLLDECGDCSVCMSACPTGAIGQGRVLLHAGRCLTLANEAEGGWPDWTPHRAHHCLIGCLACQRCCPVNPKLPVEDSGVCFSANESRTLLRDNGPTDRRSENGIRVKLAWLGQPSVEPLLGRNLRALVAARGKPPEVNG
jgi:epoxyqueuosine reductase